MYGIFNLDNPQKKSGRHRILRSVFGKESQEKARMVLVEGSPGIGKTTFCLKIANDWARKAIPKKYDFPVFKLMLLLKCRDMDGDVMHAIADQLLPEDMKEKKKNKLMNYIRDEKKQEKILIILDGLDELPQMAEQSVDKLLERKVLSRCSVLATSRQEKGIEIRQRHVFDTLLQINGFTIEDASEYIRKHFRNVDPVDFVKGEILIQTIQENISLHALRNNPLNLLLLCVVFEDHEGELPSNRTKLYQIIYRCLLRRFCSKNDMKVDKEDDIALENRFEGSTHILGELAWRCLLEERLSFLQEELDKLEDVRTNDKRVSASKVGLVFMEASVKKLNPKHQYHFLHRTFQEFLAAAYLVQLMKGNISIFCKFRFNKSDVTSKYRQVFLFAAGILGKDGASFFKQIGEIIFGTWSCHCLKGDGPFLFELLNESGAASELAKVVCRSISIPQSLELNFKDPHTLRLVRYACEASSNTSDTEPWQLHKLSPTEVYALDEDSASDLLCILENSKALKDLVISTDDMTGLFMGTLLKGLASNSSLSSITLKSLKNIPADVATELGTSLSLCNSLTTVRLKLFSVINDSWARAVSIGLLKSTQLNSVFLEFYGLLGSTVVEAFKPLLSKTSLISLSLTVFGDMDDCLASALSEGLSDETGLKCLTVIVYGSLSDLGGALLAKGFLKNRTLDSLMLKVLGDVPEHWTALVDKIHGLAAEKSMKSLTVHPNVQGKFVGTSSSLNHPISRGDYLEKTLTLNVFGELSIRIIEVLGNHLLQTSPLSSLTLNVNGKMSNNIADCLVHFFVTNNVLLSLTIFLSGEISSYGQTALQRLHREGHLQSFILNVDASETEDWECLSAQNDGSTSSALSIDIHDTTPNEVSEIFSGSRSLTELSVTVHNNVGKLGNWRHFLPNVLSQIESLTSLSLTVHNYAGSGIWGYSLGEGLSSNNSLTSFALTVHDHTDTECRWGHGLGQGLSNNKSLTTFRLTVHNYTRTLGSWGSGLGDGLSQNMLLATFSLTVHNHSSIFHGWRYVLEKCLSNNKSLPTFCLTVYDYTDTLGNWGSSLSEALSNNNSLTSFCLTVHGYANISGWGYGLGQGLSKNQSLTSFTLTVHDYADPVCSWGYSLFQGLSKNISLTTFSLAVYNYANSLGGWGRSLDEAFSNNKSLTSFILTVHNYAYTSGSWEKGLSRGLPNNNSLTSFNLTVHNYTHTLGSWGKDLGEGLSNNKSLTAFSLTVHQYTGTLSGLGLVMAEGLSGNRSLTTFSLTIHNYADMSEGWAHNLAKGFSKSCSLTSLKLVINDHTGVNRDLDDTLFKSLEEIESLTSLSISVSFYGEDNVKLS